jgi:hypothetical protein
VSRILILASLLIPVEIFSQVIEHPNYSLSSHPTLTLDKIEFAEGRTMLYFTITNEKLGGSFCIDSASYLKNSLGDDVYLMTGIGNLPACPETYRFRSIGESRTFVLYFPEINRDLRYIDFVEPCDDACISMRYILLDANMNGAINKGFSLYDTGKYRLALQHFEDILAKESDNYSPVFGSIYLYLMTISYDLGDSGDVKRFYNDLKSSSIINKDDIIEVARNEGIIR